MKKIHLPFMYFILTCFFLGTADFASCEAEDQLKYLVNRVGPGMRRHDSFRYALQLMEERNVKTLVETGTSRCGDKNFEWDGGSTIIFGDWASQNDATLYSVDISPQGVEAARQVTATFGDHVVVTCSDSIEFLYNFDKQIDFLYLDSYDFDSSNPNPSQEHHLQEIIAAYPLLHENSIVLIDDCALPHGGKGKLVINFLLDNGWKIIFNSYQVMLAKN